MAQALEPDPRGDWLRMIGGVLLAVGAAVLFVRKADDWAAFPLLLAVGIPCAIVFALGAMGALAADAVDRWHAVLMVAGVLLSVLAFGQLWDVVGIDTDSAGFGFLLFACVAALAAFASFRVGAAYQALLAAVAGIVAWLFFFEMILDDPSGTTFRWLLLVLCVVYAVTAFALRERDAPQAAELVTAAGIAGVLVGLAGLVDGAGSVLGAVLFDAQPLPGGEGQSFVWDLFLLVFSVVLVVYGAVAETRGPAYVGLFGLLAFAFLQGLEVNALLEGAEPDSSFLGWPLILILLGAAALAAGAVGPKPPPAGTRVPSGPRSPEPETTYDVRS
jgi:hypothetical protein